MGPAPYRLRLCGSADVCGGDPCVCVGGEWAFVPANVTASECDGGWRTGLTLSELSRYWCYCND